MSERGWDDEEFEVPPPLPPTKVVDDRWAGEDEEKVKDNWDDEEDDVRQNNTAGAGGAPPARKKTKKQIIAEKQAKKEEELAVKRAEIDRMNNEMTPEERLTEKLRLQKVQEESDLQFAVDLMGLRDSDSGVPELTTFAEADLTTEKGLAALGAAVVNKIRSTEKLERKTFYVPFLETFCKNLCTNLELEELKKVTASLNSLYNDKVKANKPVKGKKKAAGKAKIHIGKESDSVSDDRYIDELDDFI